MALAPPAPERSRISEVEMERYYCLLQAAARLDSSAAETIIPLCAKDISDNLRKKFAFLSGGRGKDNGWIITFPENSHFNEASEEVLTKVLTYLTSLPRYGAAFLLSCFVGRGSHLIWCRTCELRYNCLIVNEAR
ncbi:guanine nucleotide exchange factor DBS-like [Dermochelys coriacea]|uniref:guanine nucleotide exchange factor DBS-like n=1 Tax=Dermochelys coriacea TaxID=27794 RepID=UPI0018E7D012|nr:guanine nucleotide exchange factor DBS-like [Dermochelys coriacea]